MELLFSPLYYLPLHPLICLPDPSHNLWSPPPPPFLPRAHLQQRIRASGKNQQSALGAVPLFCEAAQLLTVFFALPCKCAGIKAGVMGRRLCGGLFPKPTAAPYNGQGFPWSSSSFFCGRRRKIMTGSFFFCLLAVPSAPCFSLSLRCDSLLQSVDMSIQSLIGLTFLSFFFMFGPVQRQTINVLPIYLLIYLYSVLSWGLSCLGVCRSCLSVTVRVYKHVVTSALLYSLCFSSI